MNAYQIAKRFNLSLTKSKKIAKAMSVPKPKDRRTAEMRLNLSRGLHLSARNLLALLMEPGLIKKLGDYENIAREQLNDLGDVAAEAAPTQVTQHIASAAAGDRDSVEIVMGWLKRTLPAKPVRFHWIAVRLLIDRWPDLRTGDFGRVNLALKNVRAHPDFDEWWNFEPIGSHWPVVYRRPRLQFDL